jgi:hypothetical protein
MDTFSRLWIEHFIHQLGHEITARTHVYWSPPSKDLHDGLVCVKTNTL